MTKLKSDVKVKVKLINDEIKNNLLPKQYIFNTNANYSKISHWQIQTSIRDFLRNNCTLISSSADKYNKQLCVYFKEDDQFRDLFMNMVNDEYLLTMIQYDEHGNTTEYYNYQPHQLCSNAIEYPFSKKYSYENTDIYSNISLADINSYLNRTLSIGETYLIEVNHQLDDGEIYDKYYFICTNDDIDETFNLLVNKYKLTKHSRTNILTHKCRITNKYRWVHGGIELISGCLKRYSATIDESGMPRLY